jgi:hypothetical protein
VYNGYTLLPKPTLEIPSVGVCFSSPTACGLAIRLPRKEGMLTFDDALGVAKLIDQCGEPAPGYLVDGTANLESLGATPDIGVLAETMVTQEEAHAAPVVKFSILREIDCESGEVRFVVTD